MTVLHFYWNNRRVQSVIVIVIVIIDNMVKQVRYSCVTRGQGRGGRG